MIPHISYDLDGDGIVGGRDLVIANIFDKDKKGSLTAEEREAALKALRDDNLEKNFMWGLEQSGANTEVRVFQKRGVIIRGEDYTQLKETYPVHPLSLEPRRYESRIDMIKQRKARNVSELD